MEPKENILNWTEETLRKHWSKKQLISAKTDIAQSNWLEKKKKTFFPFCPLSRANTPSLPAVCLPWALSIPSHEHTQTGGYSYLRDFTFFPHPLCHGAGTWRILSYLQSTHDEPLLQASVWVHMACHNQQVSWSLVSAGKWEEKPSFPGSGQLIPCSWLSPPWKPLCELANPFTICPYSSNCRYRLFWKLKLAFSEVNV